MHETIPPETSGKRKKERKNRSRYPRAVSLILSTLLRIAAVDSGYLIFERAYSEREGGGGGGKGVRNHLESPGSGEWEYSDASSHTTSRRRIRDALPPCPCPSDLRGHSSRARLPCSFHVPAYGMVSNLWHFLPGTNIYECIT